MLCKQKQASGLFPGVLQNEGEMVPNRAAKRISSPT